MIRRLWFPWITVVIVVLAVLVSLPFVHQLPEQVAVQWTSGAPSNYVSRSTFPWSYGISALVPVASMCVIAQITAAHNAVHAALSSLAVSTTIFLVGMYAAVIVPQRGLETSEGVGGPSITFTSVSLVLAVAVVWPLFGATRRSSSSTPVSG